MLFLLKNMMASLIRSEESIRRHSRSLIQSNTRLDIAFNNMSQGLCFFDGSRKLIVSNLRYLEMYGLAAADVYPGQTLEQIVELRSKAGTGSKMTSSKYLTWRNSVSGASAASDTVVELNDARFIRIKHMPMSDGGWVATHEDVTASKRDEARIIHLAQHDTLTGLANRSLFNEILERACLKMRSDSSLFAVFLLDLDRFKSVNDSMGHAAGDLLLKIVAERLIAMIGSNDVVARMGGDEFAILCFLPPHTDSLAACQRLADVFLIEMGKPFDIGNVAVSIGASVGIALTDNAGSIPDDLLKRADLALYKSKRNGKNTYTVFDPSFQVEAEQVTKTEVEMRHAILASQFEVHYQPIVDAGKKQVVGAEALVRWRHPERGLIAPGHFIPLAETTGLIVPIGEFVLRQACRDAVGWPSDVMISVNLSAIQFRRTNIFDMVVSALSESGLPPQRLELEVTESILLDNEEEHSRVLHRLKGIGVSIALDDFGTGYSSLSYLKNFPFDKIKIDRSFIADVEENEGSMAIVSAIVHLARGLNIATTAEGIETERQSAVMRAAGVDFIQGYLYGRPSPVIEINRSLLVQQTV